VIGVGPAWWVRLDQQGYWVLDQQVGGGRFIRWVGLKQLLKCYPLK